MSLVPPFTKETAHAKVKAGQDLWNTRDPARVALAYTENCIWRNRSTFIRGREEIISFLTQKWERELDYKLRKELFTFEDNKIVMSGVWVQC
jgi:nuclear transport factor 2 (NTF2) superfamily protein